MRRKVIVPIAIGSGIALLFFVLQFTVKDMSQQIAIVGYTIAGLLIVGGIIGLTPVWNKLISFTRIKFCTKSKKWVTCDKCGFIGVRNIETRELEEVEDNQRKTGRLVLIRINPLGDTKPRHEKMPECLMQIQDFAAIPPLATHSLPLFYMQMPRQCQHFTTWQKGLSPKEHRGIWYVLYDAVITIMCSAPTMS